MHKCKKIRVAVLWISLITGPALFGQTPESEQPGGNYYVPLNGYTYHVADRMDIQYKYAYQNLHTTAVKPYLREQVAGLTLARAHSGMMSRRERFNADYLCNDNREFCALPGDDYYTGDLLNFFYPEPATFYQFFSVRVNPVIHTVIGHNNNSAAVQYANTRGIELRGSVDDKVGFYFYATDNQEKLPAYVQARVDDAPQVVPGEGVAKIFSDNGVDYFSARGYVSFNATEHIAMQFGHDKVFIGDGIRSMIWSDNSNDHLMFRINTKIWRVQYMNMFTELANYDGSNIYNSLIHKKYAALHHINIPITPTLHLGFFESVVFDRYNAMGRETGFELNYLNPVIFYRAVESGLGSSDNALIGTNLKWNFLNRFSLYGQFVLDEFVAKEFVAGNGWWGNKYAIQAGLKYIDAFTIDQLDLQFEYNLARPYTYSYEDDNGSSYTHYAQAIAHPLGANFREQLVSIWYQPAPKITLQNRTMFALRGTDTAGINYGGDIFQDYNSFVSTYGNTIGQGVAEKLLLNDLILSYYFWHNVSIDARVIFRKADNEISALDKKELFFTIGVRMNEVLKWHTW